MEGIPFAFTLENPMGGHMNTVQLDSVLLNRVVEEKVFRMP
ncbi:MAG: hypothetical protein NTY96_00590 [Bacteroidetes bacterium]|nr:hypothetical protein [Bacteroidota bacterium]